MLGPTLRGEKVTLEAPQLDDLEVFRHWFGDMDIMRTLSVRGTPSAQQEREWYDGVAASDHLVAWKISVQGRAIGTTSIMSIDWKDRHGITGTVIGEKSEWGKGYASEAVRLRTRYAFDELGLERLESESLAENPRMHRALEKSGYRRIGTRRHFTYRGGVWHDMHIFEVLRDEWRAEQD